MSNNCLICNEKIKMLGLGATKFEDGKICYSCSHKINPIIEMYGKRMQQYSLEQLTSIYRDHLEQGSSYRKALKDLFSKQYDLEEDIKEHDKSARLAVEDVKTQIKGFLKKYDGEKERLVNICERGYRGSLTMEMWDAEKATLKCVNGLEELVVFAEERLRYWEEIKETLKLIQSIETYYFTERVLPSEKELFGFEGAGEIIRPYSGKEEPLLKDIITYMSKVSEKSYEKESCEDIDKNAILDQYSNYYNGLSDLYVKKVLMQDRVLHAEGLKRHAEIMYTLWTIHDFEYARTDQQTAQRIRDSKRKIADCERNLDKLKKEQEEIEVKFLETLNVSLGIE